MSDNNLIKSWELAAKDLGLEIKTSFKLMLSSGFNIETEFLLKNFGGSKGMIVINSYDQVAKHINEIVKEGYGFSVLSEPNESEPYEKNTYIELLKDWGWTGGKSNKPIWL